ncbi:3-deoxy-D-manno-octulosonic acid transferase [Roseovarius sp. LXJ103]|uniref:3-deoxy-D-manno-octulosonic acid transferase n=1 Tax=Roseovarius carneus TaxID=2853164 RepID=UPI000D6082FC|nr:glycosyltransferase N-terminal domain-containing protein [Roseovarius carneus]MBZ8118153.1 3-deoxy-D-manno-octulosonic acid transferase [Roseovarius carneus]PWE36115.1 3-deoxy-D-manno-octulosonic acid transferase [Pelagicola sp. LXJ1103]
MAQGPGLGGKKPRSAGAVLPDGPRPEGALIWGHANSLDHANALVQLAERLAVLRPGLTMLITTAPGLPEIRHRRAPILHVVLPDENGSAADAFLGLWRPDMCLWTGGKLIPSLITAADKRHIPLFLVDAQSDYLERPGWRWVPQVQRSLLGRFAAILARDEATRGHLHRLGVRDGRITVTGLFREGALALPCSEALRDEMAGVLRGRPVWLAARVQAGEVDMILHAHRQTTRLAHRLILILVPEELEDLAAIRAQLEEAQLRYTLWSEGAMPEEVTQVILADTRGEMGLWYRLASITLMGSSLVAGHGGRDPNEPAAHGSAILYGPNVGRYLPSYSRYAEAGAARIVRDAGTLAAALARLIAVDQSAAMAHAAWDIASASAQVTDQILDLVQDTLDTQAAG